MTATITDVDVVRSVFGTFASGNLATLSDLLHADATWHHHNDDRLGGIHRGTEAIIAYAAPDERRQLDHKVVRHPGWRSTCLLVCTAHGLRNASGPGCPPPIGHPPRGVSATWQMIRDRATSRLRCRAESREDVEIMTFTPVRADGPLAVSTRNPRYFTPASGPGAGRAVYLTGSHIWNNLHDGMGRGPAGPDGPAGQPRRVDLARLRR